MKSRNDKKRKIPHRSLGRHHKIPRSRGGDNSRNNIKFLTRYEHHLWNELFAAVQLSPNCIALIIKTFGRQRFLEHRPPHLIKKYKKNWKSLGFTYLSDEKIAEKIERNPQLSQLSYYKKLFWGFSLEPDEIIVICQKFGREIFLKRNSRKKKIYLLKTWEKLFKGISDDMVKVEENIKKKWS